VHDNFSILLRKFESVRHEVDQHLEIAALVTVDFLEVGLFTFKVLDKLNVFLAREVVQHGKCFVDNLVQVEVLVVNAECAALELREVQ